jgi:hypothetical protein
MFEVGKMQSRRKEQCMTGLMRLILVLSLFAQICVASQGMADGLIFSLPPDGTWVEFSGSTDSNYKMDLPPEVLARMDAAGKAKMQSFLGPQKMRETLRVSSVGSEKYGDKPCRWIELRRSVKSIDSETNAERSNRRLLLKLLVPEKDLVRGGSPLDSSYLAFFNPKEVDIKHVPNDPGFDRIRYEIERFLNCFPPPLEGEKRLANETIATAIGTFKDCEVIRGKTQFDRPLMGGGRWTERLTWTIDIHRDAPFGVVRVKNEGSNEEIPPIGHALGGSVTRELTISSKGEKAVSELQEGKRKVLPPANAP